MLVHRAAIILLLASGIGSAEEAPALSGTWKLNHQLSEDIEAKIKAAAGSQYMSGGPSWATETWFPWGTSFSEGQRLQVRDVLLATVPALEGLIRLYEMTDRPDQFHAARLRLARVLAGSGSHMRMGSPLSFGSGITTP